MRPDLSIHAQRCACGRCAPPALRRSMSADVFAIAIGALLATVAGATSVAARAAAAGGLS